MEKIEAPDGDESKIGFQFPQPQRSGQRVIKLENIHHAYGENVVYQGMDFRPSAASASCWSGPTARANPPC